jgi:hypothetical protein
MDFRNKLECLSLSRFSSLVLCLWVRPEAYPRVEHLKGASLLQKSVNYGQKSLITLAPGQWYLAFTFCLK